MLMLSNCVVDRIMRDCKNASEEQGWLIGCKMHIEKIDACCLLIPSYADENCYVLDSENATQAIRQWAENDVCIIGFIHSHLVDKENLSRADVDSAATLLKNLDMPFLYFGVVVVNTDIKFNDQYPIFIYRAFLNDDQEYTVEQVAYTVNSMMSA